MKIEEIKKSKWLIKLLVLPIRNCPLDDTLIGSNKGDVQKIIGFISESQV